MKKPLIIFLVLVVIIGAGYLSDWAYPQPIPTSYDPTAIHWLSTHVAGDILYNDASTNDSRSWIVLAKGTAGQFLNMNAGATAPQWSTLTIHAESHNIASHSDTSATGTELDTLTDNSIADILHRHSELVASDGSPDPALSVDSVGRVGIGTAAPEAKLHIENFFAAPPDDLGDFDNYHLVILGEINTGRHAGMLFSTDINTYGGSAIVHYDTGAGGVGDLVFYTKQSISAIPPVEVMRLDDTGDVTAAGALEGAVLTEGGVAIYNLNELNEWAGSASITTLGTITTGAWRVANGIELATATTASNYKTFYSDGSGDVQELANGTTAYILTSQGTGTAPHWAVAPGAAGGDAWGDPVDAHIIPTGADDTYDVGSSTAQFRNGYFDGTLEADVLTEGGNDVYNSSETPGGELGGTWASPTIDDDVIDFTEIVDAMTMDTPTTIAMANNSLTMNFTTPSDGLTLNSTGAFTNHLLHLYQSAGNPGAGTALMHLSYVDVDIIPIFSDHVGVQASAIIQKYQLNKSNNDTSDNDELYDSWYFDQDGTVTAQGEIEFIRITYVATDTSEDTEDAQIEWDLMSNGTLTERMVLNNAGQLQMDGGVTTAGTVEGATLTEGGVGVLNSTELSQWTGSASITTLGADSVSDNEIDYSNVTLDDFDYQGNYKTFYTDGSGDVQELANGTNTWVLTSQGTGTAPAWAEATGGGATAWDDISDPDNSGLITITFDNAEATLFTGDNDAAVSFMTIQNSDADHTGGNMYLLDLDYSADDGDVDADFIKFQDSGSVVMTIQQNGEIATDGGITAGGTVEGATLTEGGVAILNTGEYDGGTDPTADLEEETHASEHAVSGADTTYPADPGADGILLWDDNPGVLEWAAIGAGLSYDGSTLTATGATTAWDDIADPDADDTIALTGYEIRWSTTLDEVAHVAVRIDHIDADVTAETTLFQIQSRDVGDTDLTYIRVVDSSWDAYQTIFSVGASGAVDIGHATDTTLSRASGGVLQVESNALTRDIDVPGMTSTTPEIIYAFNIHDIDAGYDDIALQFPRAMTITKVTAMCIGGTNVIGRLYEVDGDGDDSDAVGVEVGDWTFTTTETEDSSFNNATLDAGDYLQWDTTSVSGSVTNFRLTVEGYET